MKLGFHVSIKDGIDKSVDRAHSIGCDTFQIFTQSPRMWQRRELREDEVTGFRQGLRETGISPVFTHMPYLPNLSSPDPVIYGKSVNTLAAEVQRCNRLNIPYLVTHLGSHLGTGTEKGVERIVGALNRVLSAAGEKPTILLENTSGKRNEVGSTFGELQTIIEKAESDNIGICLDTCHAYTRGYNIATPRGLSETLEELEHSVGYDKLYLVHLNDSRDPLGSRRDRHEHIGLGQIGEAGFREILNSELRNYPMVMETPMDERRSDIDNMRNAKELAGLDVSE
ncbi:deoxyribonuclease IV [Candidatus Bathyarchaeota archaeon]|nr:deoxyribonuclease IV [Candidatus Bathyarchaeota archaeon]